MVSLSIQLFKAVPPLDGRKRLDILVATCLPTSRKANTDVLASTDVSLPVS